MHSFLQPVMHCLMSFMLKMVNKLSRFVDLLQLAIHILFQTLAVITFVDSWNVSRFAAVRNTSSTSRSVHCPILRSHGSFFRPIYLLPYTFFWMIRLSKEYLGPLIIWAKYAFFLLLTASTNCPCASFSLSTSSLEAYAVPNIFKIRFHLIYFLVRC